MLCKCSGKYIDIYFILKITYLFVQSYSKSSNLQVKLVGTLDVNLALEMKGVAIALAFTCHHCLGLW